MTRIEKICIEALQSIAQADKDDKWFFHDQGAGQICQGRAKLALHKISKLKQTNK